MEAKDLIDGIEALLHQVEAETDRNSRIDENNIIFDRVAKNDDETFRRMDTKRDSRRSLTPATKGLTDTDIITAIDEVLRDFERKKERNEA